MEPTSGAGIGLLGWKLLAWALAAGGIAAGLAAIIVMCMTPPRSIKELAVALISTFVSSLTLGSLIVLWIDLHEELIPSNPVSTLLAIMAIGGVLFSAGLPGWAVVRWFFNAVERRKGMDFVQIVKEIQELKELKASKKHSEEGES